MTVNKRRPLTMMVAIGAVLAGLLGWWWWLGQPVAHDPSAVDPAVAYLNRDGRMAGRLKEGYFTHAGRTLHYVEAGTGQPVVFIHGFPSTWFSFLRQIEGLSPRYRVIAIDGLGAGRSDAPTEVPAYRLEAMGAQVIALLDHLQIAQANFVGHDWGAALAFGLAQRYPGRVRSVTGIGAPPQTVILAGIETDPRIRKRAAYIERLKRASPLLLVLTGGTGNVWDRAYAPLVEAGRLNAGEGEIFSAATGSPRRMNAHINWYRANIPAPAAITDAGFWPSRGARIPVPALVIWGAEDRVFDPGYAPAIAAIADDLQMLKIPGTGHWPHLDTADKVTAAIVARIESARLAADGD